MIPDSQQAQICTDGSSLVSDPRPKQKVFLNVETCTLKLSIPDVLVGVFFLDSKLITRIITGSYVL